MKKKILFIVFPLLLAMPVLLFAGKKKEPDFRISMYEHARENARFEHDSNVFNSRTNKRIRARKLAKENAIEAKKKMEEAQDEGEGQVKVKF